ncbi:MAG: Allophanate hydrolase 2 subunit 2, partial [uncultured Frankineae bacterium]
ERPAAPRGALPRSAHDGAGRRTARTRGAGHRALRRRGPAVVRPGQPARGQPRRRGGARGDLRRARRPRPRRPRGRHHRGALRGRLAAPRADPAAGRCHAAARAPGDRSAHLPRGPRRPGRAAGAGLPLHRPARRDRPGAGRRR